MNTFEVDIISNENICDGTYKMVMSAPSEFLREFRPGQFIHMKVPGRNELMLRRPISVHAVSDATVTVIYKVLGKGTEHLSRLKLHDVINILGPVGRGFPMKREYRSIALVGGGLGCAPLMSVPAVDKAREYHAFLGFGSANMMYMTSDMEAACDTCSVSTDDGSYGFKGNSVEMLEEFLKTNKADAIFACGPVPMMKGLKNLNTDIPVFLSLEERMGCGYGACLTCVCKTKSNGHERVCVDGPVFPAEEVEL